MADSDDPAAVSGRPAAVADTSHDTLLDELKGGVAAMNAALAKISELELRLAKADSADGEKNPKTSRASFKRASAAHQSRLLSLPPEIRNMIWKLCLFHQEGLTKKLDEKLQLGSTRSFLTIAIDTSSREARPPLREAYENSFSKRTRRCISEYSLRNLALMQTCQSVYVEAAPVLWGQRFHFQSITQLQAFLFSNARLDLVRDIFVLSVDRYHGFNSMPAVSVLLADKVKGLERFDVDMSSMYKHGELPPGWRKLTDKDVKQGGERLGFDVYSCMYPWVTKVVRDQGIERLMAILHIPRKNRKTCTYHQRVHSAFGHTHILNPKQEEMADTATAGEILRLVNLYDK